jgi:RNA polymerase sigma-70 factor, ECF subfamily
MNVGLNRESQWRLASNRTSLPGLFMLVLNDDALIQLALAGQADSFKALMDRHLLAVRKQIFWMVPDGNEIDDVLQDVQLKVWRHLSTFRSESSFRTWISRIAINEARMMRRRARPVYQYDEITLDRTAASNGCPYRSYAQLEMAQALRRAIRRLPEKFRQVLILRDLEELSTQETAQQMKAGKNLVKTRLLRARIMLAKALRRGSLTPQSATASKCPPASK